MKCVPFLSQEAVGHSGPGLQLSQARDVMGGHVVVLREVEAVAEVARVLRETEHHGFPVVRTPRAPLPPPLPSHQDVSSHVVAPHPAQAALFNAAS